MFQDGKGGNGRSGFGFCGGIRALLFFFAFVGAVRKYSSSEHLQASKLQNVKLQNSLILLSIKNVDSMASVPCFSWEHTSIGKNIEYHPILSFILSVSSCASASL